MEPGSVSQQVACFINISPILVCFLMLCFVTSRVCPRTVTLQKDVSLGLAAASFRASGSGDGAVLNVKRFLGPPLRPPGSGCGGCVGISC